MKLAFLGAGRMATAIAVGAVTERVLSPEEMVACDISPEARQAFAEASGVRCVDLDPAEFADADIVLIAVKPQKAEQALRALPRPGRQLFISIAAGIPLARLAEWLGTARLIRVMPNTPLMVGQGATAFACGPEATPADAEFAAKVFGALGYVAEVNEAMIDAVTALSGSGPAYVFEMVQAMTDAGAALGLPPEMALDLTVHTVAGAAEMLRRGLGTPDELRIAVTSPGGTTAAGLAVLDQARFRDLVAAVVRRARDRSVELGQVT